MSADKIITWDELRKHSEQNDIWVCIDGQVFDVSNYLAEHPGGSKILIKHGGKDATKEFQNVGHSSYAISLRDNHKIGVIEQKKPSVQYEKWAKHQLKINTEYTFEEVISHQSKGDIWVVIDRIVYDLSEFANQHPGGKDVLIKTKGTDALKQFQEAKHPESVKKQMKDYQVGIIQQGSQPPPKQMQIDNQIRLYLVIFGILLGFIYTKFFK
ncbi:Cytochrome b5-like heme/steroid binding domain [Pseudocohnilembus persalinus]|uniref:Cytochrome b5-like heme/steroid binding domain n=1 Tax=Pseudocohnilembus persalinus TaxID=266149 RepID=A0A0V0QHD5_PSEPJ|nr:Cytochrome b5-like heme/steroid binding domain [Pseudocohnilembus persalinus]|eukprot:KRX01582.1 Cytochrome b5-like heme/steroid binding domain [Pseudocohnilembus persalinus]